MESQELRIFREVARAGSISKAAGQLGGGIDVVAVAGALAVTAVAVAMLLTRKDREGGNGR